MTYKKYTKENDNYKKTTPAIGGFVSIPFTGNVTTVVIKRCKMSDEVKTAMGNFKTKIKVLRLY